MNRLTWKLQAYGKWWKLSKVPTMAWWSFQSSIIHRVRIKVISSTLNSFKRSPIQLNCTVIIWGRIASHRDASSKLVNINLPTKISQAFSQRDTTQSYSINGSNQIMKCKIEENFPIFLSFFRGKLSWRNKTSKKKEKLQIKIAFTQNNAICVRFFIVRSVASAIAFAIA